MCIRDRVTSVGAISALSATVGLQSRRCAASGECAPASNPCLLYTSDAADERSSVDLGGRRIIKKKKAHADTVCSDIILIRYSK